MMPPFVRSTSAISCAKKYSDPRRMRGLSPVFSRSVAAMFSSFSREVFCHRPRSTCGVATIVSMPSARAIAQRSTASAQSRGPSSTPGRQWWWMSIKLLPRLAYRRFLAGASLGVVVVVVALLERVAVLLEVEVIEDRAEDRDVALAQTLGRALHDVARRLPAMHAEDDAVGIGRGHDRIGHRHDRRGVEDHVGELRADLVDEVLHPIRRQQLGWIRRREAGEDDRQVRHF